MKHRRFFPLLLGSVIGIAAFCLSACPTDTEPDTDYGTEAVITAVENAGPVYFSFRRGETVDSAEAAGTGWDLAFNYTRMIHTNSGDTAALLNSGGKGGVWAAPDTTDLDTEISPGDADFSLPFAVDTSRWTSPAAEMGSPVLNQLNVISYVGYGTGGGEIEADPLTDYRYNARQYYRADLSTMPPVYSVTRQVYIVKHGDGEHYSKMHITALETLPSTSGAKRIFMIRYKNF
jgi:hypothetical protein